jgi:hypothetical protein
MRSGIRQICDTGDGVRTVCRRPGACASIDCGRASAMNRLPESAAGA